MKPATAIALLALVLALTSPAWGEAARKLVLKKGQVTSKHVKDRSLKAKDLKRGVIRRGATGPTGPRGEQGVPGPQGATLSEVVVDSGLVTLEDQVVPVMTIPGLGEVIVFCDADNDYAEFGPRALEGETFDGWYRWEAGEANPPKRVVGTDDSVHAAAPTSHLTTLFRAPGGSFRLEMGTDAEHPDGCAWTASVIYAR